MQRRVTIDRPGETQASGDDATQGCHPVGFGRRRRGALTPEQGADGGALDQFAHRNSQAEVAFRPVADLHRHQGVEAQVVQRRVTVDRSTEPEAAPQ